MSDRDDKPPEAPPPNGSGSARKDEAPAAGEGGEPRAPAEPGAAETREGEAAAAAEAAPRPAEDEAAEKEAAAKAKAEAAAKAKAAAEARAAAEAAKPPWERTPQAPEWREADDDPLAAALRQAHGEAVVSARSLADDLVVELAPTALAEVAADLKENHGYRLFVDLCGAHYPQREEGAYEVVCLLYSFDANRRVRLKVRADEGVEVPSLSGVWVGANWPEREAWDMFGIRFTGHPDMTRILMWEGFNGHPLRKDFPVEGIDTGAAIYPEYYEEEAGPVTGTGTGWKPAPPPQEEEEAEDSPEAP